MKQFLVRTENLANLPKTTHQSQNYACLRSDSIINFTASYGFNFIKNHDSTIKRSCAFSQFALNTCGQINNMHSSKLWKTICCT